MDTQRPPDDAAQAVRDLGEMLSSALAGSSAPPMRTVGRRYDAVADQMMASLDAYGLPHEGVQLTLADDEAAARSRLIDGLKRNFSFKEEDGFRSYFRSNPQPLPRDGERDGRLLRGATLVNATTVRAAADGIMATLDQLPDFDRFVLAHPRRTELRDRIRRILDQLNETASDPTGVNVPRGSFLHARLRGVVAELVTTSGLLPSYLVERPIDPAKPMEDPYADRQSSTFEQLRDRASAVRNEEVRATVLALMKLVDQIGDVVTTGSAGMSRGLAAARLEELLSSAYYAAVAFEEELSRAGTSTAEQSVQFFRPDSGSEESELSVGQYLSWVRAVCEPFTGAANDAADLMYDEAGSLATELTRLSDYASALASVRTPGTVVGLPGVRRQLAELRQLLADAVESAERIKEPSAASTKPPTNPVAKA